VSGGYALIAHLLRRDGGRRISPALLPSMEGLVRSVGRWAGPGGEGEQAAVRLLLDLRLWGGPAGSLFRSKALDRRCIDAFSSARLYAHSL